MESDLELAREQLEKKVAIRSLQEQRNFFDFLHFSPLKVNPSAQPSESHFSRSLMKLMLTCLPYCHERGYTTSNSGWLNIFSASFCLYDSAVMPHQPCDPSTGVPPTHCPPSGPTADSRQLLDDWRGRGRRLGRTSDRLRLRPAAPAECRCDAHRDPGRRLQVG